MLTVWYGMYSILSFWLILYTSITWKFCLICLFIVLVHSLTSYCAWSHCSEFQLIHELCLYVLSVSQRTELMRATLSTLHAFLSWIPLGYIFESPLVRKMFLFCCQSFHLRDLVLITLLCICTFQLETLLKFFPMPQYRNLALQCLTEVWPFSFLSCYLVALIL